jgi:hypothetical protein
MTPRYEAAGERALALATTRPAGSLRAPLSRNGALSDRGGPADDARFCDGLAPEIREDE